MPHRAPRKTVKRRPPHRAARERVLVVCEGEYTEPRYFAALRDHLRLNTLAVKATKGGDPRTLVNIASNEVQRERRNGEQFDFVYCVFDRDAHPQFHQASRMARDRKFQLARSWPCFELWLLLHFEYVRAPYVRKGSASPCDVCIRDLRQHLPNYSKGDQKTFDSLWHLLEQTVVNGQERQPRVSIHEPHRGALTARPPSTSCSALCHPPWRF